MKNQYIAAVLSFIISGLGQVYLGFYKRFLISFIIDLIISLLVLQVSFELMCIISTILSLYFAYDAYLCTNAINDNNDIPLLFTKLDIQ